MKKALSTIIISLFNMGLILSPTASAQSGNYTRNTENGLTPGSDNTIIGYSAGNNLNSNANKNVLIGRFAGYLAQDLRSSILLGSYAGYSLQIARFNIMIGDSAGFKLQSNRDVWANTPYGSNIFIGAKAGASVITAHNTILIGHNAGAQAKGLLSDNVIVGNYAGVMTSGTNNTFVGNYAGWNDTTGNENTYVGMLAGANNSSGYSNIFLGYKAGQNTSSPSRSAASSVMIGRQAGENQSGEWNIFIGDQSAIGQVGSSTGSRNIAIGGGSGRFISSASNNTFIGHLAGESLTIGKNNAFFGSGAGWRSYIAENNTMIGTEAGYENQGSRNVFVGYRASADRNVSSNDNVYVGSESGLFNMGSQNVAIGQKASCFQYNGNHNVVIGNVAGYGSSNFYANHYSQVVIIGDSAGFSNIGNANVFLGRMSGISNKEGSFNTYLGHFSRGVGIGADNLQNATAIGANSLVGVSNGFVLGDTTNTNVGIGTAYPNQRLTIRGNMNFLTASNLRLDNSPFLDINQNRLALGGEKGEFPVEITSSLRYKVTTENQWADYVFAPAFRKLPLKDVAVFIQQNGHLPGIPSAKEVVQNGVDAAQMDARLLAQIEQLTLHAIEQKTENEQLKAENKALKEQFSALLRRVEKLERK